MISQVIVFFFKYKAFPIIGHKTNACSDILLSLRSLSSKMIMSVIFFQCETDILFMVLIALSFPIFASGNFKPFKCNEDIILFHFKESYECCISIYDHYILQFSVQCMSPIKRYFVVPMGVIEAAIASYFGFTSYAGIALTM